MARALFIHANLLDGEQPAKPGSSVLVEDDRIVTVTTGAVATQSGDLVVDCTGLTVMPGMVSGHFHATYRDVGPALLPPLGFEQPPAYQAYLAADNARMAIQAGVTSVVGANAPFDIDPSLAAAIRDGLLLGPRVIAGSRDLITTADSNDTTPWWWESHALGGVRICDGPDGFRQGVRDEIRRGAEIVKLFATGGHGIRLSAETASITQAELNAAVEAAHSLGKRSRAHVASKAGIMACLEAGIDVIDHGDGLDDECVKAMAESGTFLIPSIHSAARQLESGNPRFRDDDFRAMCKHIPAAIEAGVRVCLGDDYGAQPLPHGLYGNEPGVLVKYASLSPLEALRCATVNGGALVGLDNLGRIEDGAVADLLVVNGDPSVDISVLGQIGNIRAVIRDGLLLIDNLAKG